MPVPASAWELSDPIEILRHIEEWRTFDLRNSSFDAVEARVKELRDRVGRAIITRRTTSLPKLWRVQRFQPDRDWGRASSVLCRPGGAQSIGRCHGVGDCVLYCATDAATAFEEVRDVRAVPGAEFVLIQYKGSKNFSLNKVVGNPVPRALDGTNLISGAHLIAYQIMREFVRTEFTRVVGSGTEYLYMLSAAFSRHWADYDRYHGWLYPSERSFGGENVCLKESAIQGNLSIVAVLRGKVHPHGRLLVFTHSESGNVIGDAITWTSLPGVKTLHPP